MDKIRAKVHRETIPTPQVLLNFADVRRRLANRQLFSNRLDEQIKYDRITINMNVLQNKLSRFLF